MDSINCIIETPKGSAVKYNYDPRLGCFELGKVLPSGLVFPFDFGYIPGTLGSDGDPLDVIVISEISSFPGCAVKCRIVGAIKAVQTEREGSTMRNDRYIAIPEVSVFYARVKNIRELPPQVIREIERFFINYNEQAGKRFKPLDWTAAPKAIREISMAQNKSKPTNLIQLLLPLFDNRGKQFPRKYYDAVEKKLTDTFGGVTAYSQSPASGFWKDNNEMNKDKLMVYEVMAGKIDRSFWKEYKKDLEKQFQQKELIVRQTNIGFL